MNRIEKAFQEAIQDGVQPPVANMYIISSPDSEGFDVAWRDLNGKIDFPSKNPNFWSDYSVNLIRTNWLLLGKNPQGKWEVKQIKWENPDHKQLLLFIMILLLWNTRHTKMDSS